VTSGNNQIALTTQIAEPCIVTDSQMDDYSRLKPYVEFRDSVLGAYSYVSSFSVVAKSRIGKFCSIAHGSFIGLWEHNQHVTTHSFYLFETSGGFVKGYRNYDRDSEWTRLGNDVWVGANAVVLKGVNVGDGAIVGAASVVTKDVPPYAIVVGNPARVLRYRFEEEDIAFLLQLRWWDLDRARLQEMVDLKLWFDFARFKDYCRQHNLRRAIE
jgi:acetyltransferase-like isoleucine patch superfamily enzyme